MLKMLDSKLDAVKVRDEEFGTKKINLVVKVAIDLVRTARGGKK